MSELLKIHRFQMCILAFQQQQTSSCSRLWTATCLTSRWNQLAFKFFEEVGKSRPQHCHLVGCELQQNNTLIIYRNRPCFCVSVFVCSSAITRNSIDRTLSNKVRWLRRWPILLRCFSGNRGVCVLRIHQNQNTSISSSLQITNCSFTYASPYLWNQLPSSFRQPHSVHCPPGSPHPAHITSSQTPPSLSSPITASTFHSRLKTHVFHKSFPPWSLLFLPYWLHGS